MGIRALQALGLAWDIKLARLKHSSDDDQESVEGKAVA
jgi:hypothetical protein